MWAVPADAAQQRQRRSPPGAQHESPNKLDLLCSHPLDTVHKEEDSQAGAAPHELPGSALAALIAEAALGPLLPARQEGAIAELRRCPAAAAACAPPASQFLAIVENNPLVAAEVCAGSCWRGFEGHIPQR